MDITNPFRTIVPTIEADVLEVLARADVEHTGRRVHEMAATSRSYEGVRQALERLVRQGIVLQRQAGRSHLYSLNLDHITAPAVLEIARSRSALLTRIRDMIAAWSPQPHAARLFGSVSRGDSSTDSDVDILLVRPRGRWNTDVWDDQVGQLQRDVQLWTGNDVRIIECDVTDTTGPRAEEFVREALADGIDLLARP